MFEDLRNENNGADLLDEAGFFLEAHIRKEERILFELVGERIPAEVLADEAFYQK